MTTLEGKVALITGGGRGIGRGIAIALAKAGADVAITDVDHISSAEQQYGTSEVGGLAAAQKTLEEINAVGRRAIAMHADVIRKKDTQHMVAETVRQFGGLNILVCNAGVISLSRVEEMSEEIWDLTLDVNVKGVFLSCQAAIPVLKTQGNEGCIINIASVAGKNGSCSTSALLRLSELFQSPRIERRNIDSRCLTVHDQFCHCFPGGRSIEHTPDTMPGCHESPFHSRHLSYQWQTIFSNGTIAGLFGQHFCCSQWWRKRRRDCPQAITDAGLHVHHRWIDW